MSSRPPSIPPASVAARPATDDLDAARAPDLPPSFPPGSGPPSPLPHPAPSHRPGGRRRAWRRIAVASVAIASLLTASHFSGLAPWAREIPAATALDQKLERAIDRAIAAAADDGVQLRATSGLRSVDEQRVLWRDALDQHGGPQEAARWVLPPELSAHVQGLAVDVGPVDGAAWLAANGSRWGLCQVFANEPWHFERLTTKNGTCPEQLPDPSHLLDLE